MWPLWFWVETLITHHQSWIFDQRVVDLSSICVWKIEIDFRGVCLKKCQRESLSTKINVLYWSDWRRIIKQARITYKDRTIIVKLTLHECIEIWMFNTTIIMSYRSVESIARRTAIVRIYPTQSHVESSSCLNFIVLIIAFLKAWLETP